MRQLSRARLHRLQQLRRPHAVVKPRGHAAGAPAVVGGQADRDLRPRHGESRLPLLPPHMPLLPVSAGTLLIAQGSFPCAHCRGLRPLLLGRSQQRP